MTRTMVLLMVVEERSDDDAPHYDAETSGEELGEETRVTRLPKPTLAKCGALVELARRVAR